MNNFKELEDLEQRTHGQPPVFIKKRIDGTIGVFQFMGNVIELFLPRVLGVFNNMVGGSRSNYLPIGNHDSDLDQPHPKYPNKAD